MSFSLKILRNIRRFFAAPAVKVAVYPFIRWYWKLGIFLLVIIILFTAGVVSYDLGRQSAGYDRAGARSIQKEMNASIMELGEQNLLLNRQIVELKSNLNMSLSVQDNLSLEMRYLAEENNRLKEEVSFFETLMTSGQEPRGITVARFEVNRLQQPQKFEYRLLIVQQQQRVKEFSGYFKLIINFKSSNSDNGDIVQPSAEELNKLRFKFYQRASGRFELPGDGDLLSIEVQVYRDGDSSPLTTRVIEVVT